MLSLMNAPAKLWSKFRERPPATKDQVRKRAFAILFVVSVTTAVGNNGMQSVLPAIGRQIGIRDPMVAAIYSLSALLWAISSPFWARASDKRGRKPLILVGLGGAWDKWFIDSTPELKKMQPGSMLYVFAL